MKFLKKIIKTSVDFKGYNSLLIHSLVGCNFECYGCHNYNELVLKKHDDFQDDKDIIKKIKLSGGLSDAIIFSGGEFLMNPLNDLVEFLTKVRSVFDGLIIINTNGSYPEKIKKIIELDLADGFHMDIKFNIWDKNNNKLEITNTNINEDLLLKSFQLIKNNDKGYSEFRTVDYPILSKEEKEKIKNKTEIHNVKWSLNDFF
jgi:pyruvate-formate lyase-activating enzyme